MRTSRIRPTICFYRIVRAAFLPILIAALASHAEAEAVACNGCNVVLISIDTLRADALGIYGNRRNTTPAIDEFARSGTLYQRAYSTSPKTASSHMSMFTGLPPAVHKVCNAGQGGSQCAGLSAGIRTLAEVLKEQGYLTVGMTHGGNVAGALGFARGFDRYEEGISQSIERATAFLRSPESGKRFFLFVHNYQMHDPYLVDAPYDTLFVRPYSGRIVANTTRFLALLGRGEDRWTHQHEIYWNRVDEHSPVDTFHLRAVYDGLARHLDVRMKPLLSALSERSGDTIVIFTSDHGEEFREHGKYLHDQLYEEVLRVPLIVKIPRATSGTNVAGPVSLLHLAGTVTQSLGLSGPAQFDQPKAWNAADPRPDGLEAEFLEKSTVSFLQGDQKLIVYGEAAQTLKPGRCERFNLKQDPSEKRNLGCETPDGVAIFNAWTKQRATYDELEKQYSSTPPPAQPSVSEDTLKQLKSLGYLN